MIKANTEIVISFLILVLLTFLTESSITAIDGIYIQRSNVLAKIVCKSRDMSTTSFEWFVNNKKIDDTVNIYENKSSTYIISTVEFQFVDESKIGNIYQCRRLNDKIHKESQNVKLQASPHLEIQMDESTIYAKPNETITLNCTVWGNPTPTPRWNSRQKPMIEHPVYMINTFKNRVTAEIRKFSRRNIGRYVCRANNSFKAVSKVVNLRLRDTETCLIPSAYLLVVFCTITLLSLLTQVAHSLNFKYQLNKLV